MKSPCAGIFITLSNSPAANRNKIKGYVSCYDPADCANYLRGHTYTITQDLPQTKQCSGAPFIKDKTTPPK